MTETEIRTSFAHLTTDELKRQKDICIKNNDLFWAQIFTQMISDREDAQ